jgi:hypothetical protein
MIHDKEKIENDYFEWLYNYVCVNDSEERISYKKLFKLLHNIDFDFYIRNDVNRAIDGIDLRNRFAYEKDDLEITNILDDSCSVLEMMIALAIRCEETIMYNPEYGDRTKQWFWSMIKNLGLRLMTDENYDEQYILNIIYNFMERRYEPNGKGGLFYIRDCKEDLRCVEIWTQLNLYLDKYN